MLSKLLKTGQFLLPQGRPAFGGVNLRTFGDSPEEFSKDQLKNLFLKFGMALYGSYKIPQILYKLGGREREEDTDIAWKRQNFIKKMYSIFALQLMTTTACLFPVVAIPMVHALVLENSCLYPAIFAVEALALGKHFLGETKEKEYQWLGVSTFLNGCALAFMTAESGGVVMLGFLAMTTAIFSAVASYAWVGNNFRPCKAFSCGLLTLILTVSSGAALATYTGIGLWHPELFDFFAPIFHSLIYSACVIYQTNNIVCHLEEKDLETYNQGIILIHFRLLFKLFTFIVLVFEILGEAGEISKKK